MRQRTWTNKELISTVTNSTSYRQVLHSLKLKEAGGNYAQIKKYISEFKLDISHFKGQGWNKNLHFPFLPKIPLVKILVKNSDFQSYKLKNRLLRENLKPKHCEECGWAKKAENGRLPLELHHINGNAHDHRLENLKILCPNCHSLKDNYRGLNRRARVAERFTRST